MLSVEEQRKLLRLLAMMSEEDQEALKTSPKVENRLRDQQGRFLPNESQLKTKEEYHLRSIRLVKVKGTYGTYLVKDWESIERAIGALAVISVIAILTIII
ncbi:hypothetical protein [Cytobacillus praedii]|uniref:hypothetical protein n=1 Tax=Cytobacillus praedii TaxID=1742358 RepID=UPI002E220081|nr:hypothetical protein [Cytobacillus praedii]